jgi:glucokinase
MRLTPEREAASPLAAARPTRPESHGTRTKRARKPAARVLRLVGDIGGTNARFAVAEAGAAGEMTILPTSEHPSFEHAVRTYLAAQPDPGRIREAAFAIAAPVEGDRVTFTNIPHWSFSIGALKAALGLERLTVLNDFTANALALPYLRPADLDKIGGGVAVSGRPIGILGPGTGLGVSGLIPSGGGWIPLAGEGGHASFPAESAEDSRIVEWLRARQGHISAERVLSGQGLVNLRNAIADLDGVAAPPMTPADITAAALDGTEALSRHAVNTFCAALGTVAGDLALTLGAHGGIYIAGGIVPRLGAYFAGSAFRARFEDKGRFRDYLASIPTFVVTHKALAMVGLANLP